METIIFIISIGFIVIIMMLGFFKLEQTIVEAIENHDWRMRAEVQSTRKETQEIKTRLTQVKKDLNVIERKIRKNG